MTKCVARADAIETHTQSTPHWAHFAMLETSVREAKCGTCANKRETYILISDLETRSIQRAARSVSKELKAHDWKRAVYR